MTSDNEQKLIKLLEDNLSYSKKLYEDTQKIRKYIIWQKISTIIKVLLIIIPLALAFLYLPPFLQGFVSQYRNLLDNVSKGL